ncbi:MAG: zinc dependent phospholipase C family protein [Deltaproteobacteria bacterium]
MKTLLIVGAALLVIPKAAFAWAPATHLFYAKELFSFIHLLPTPIASLIQEFRIDFLYGCIAADITIGKAYVDYLYNCHNFDVGLGLKAHAKTPAEEAFVLGYLSHLAADTVSHNFFVPYQNISQCSGRGKFVHAYWEVGLDQYYGEVAWKGIEEIITNPRTHTHDQLLDEALKDTIFSFKTNRILFSGMLAIQRLKKWQNLVQKTDLIGAGKLNPHHLAEYNRLALSAIILFFNETKKSPVYRVDPTGAATIEEATEIRTMLKKLEKKKELTPAIIEAESERFRHHVRKKFFESYQIHDPQFKTSIHFHEPKKS